MHDSLPVVALMAGGSGQRFWPLSTRSRPKQLLTFGGEDSLLRAAFKRALLLTSLERILLVTRQDLYDVLAEELPELPEENFLLEPKGANTGPCVGLTAVEAKRRFGDPAVVMLPADQRVNDRDGFHRVIDRGIRLATEEDTLVVLGITPTRPETQYGYIKVKPAESESSDWYPVERFTEKPNLNRARSFFEARGQYFWNSGMFVWRASQILNALREHSPGIYLPLEPLLEHTDALPISAITEAYESVQATSIDYAVLEQAENVTMVPANFGWDDLGQWTSLRRVFKQDRAGNTIIKVDPSAESWFLDCQDMLLYNDTDKRVALIEQKDIIVVVTDDTVMVLPSSRSVEIRKLAEHFDPRRTEE